MGLKNSVFTNEKY